eukprot:CAMPEP_0169365760 /NCGR_PEP_ID=MMETSP1017-20121227/32737_1 /TAXON_ID=342587 /ORGANISM="Karlodinium micrum, Strain CCMP2283" /LENGTH=209 /DNA_ID=CAMNT_0009463615 /DNA_START=28 /DNA_END=654 /DNA_ORIENTATION=+
MHGTLAIHPWVAIAFWTSVLLFTVGLQGCASQEQVEAMAGAEAALEDAKKEEECPKKVDDLLKDVGDRLRQDAAAVANGVAELVKKGMPWTQKDGNDMELCKLYLRGQDGIMSSKSDEVKKFIANDLGPSRKHWDGKRPSDAEFDMYTDLVATVGIEKVAGSKPGMLQFFETVCREFNEPPAGSSLLALESFYLEGFSRLHRQRKPFFG